MMAVDTSKQPIIDSHHHLWEFGRYDYGWITEGDGVLGVNYLPADLKETIDGAGVNRTVLVQTIHSLPETRWFLEMASEHEMIAGVVGWVDLTSEDVGEVLDDLKQQPKLSGIRHVVHDEPNDDWVVRDDVLRGLAEVAKRGLTFDLLFRPPHLKHTAALARRFPEMPMVIDHIAKPPIKAGRFDDWKEGLAEAAGFPNIFCKLSGMITEADHEHWKPADLKPYIDHAVEVFGPERLMFGTDWPVCLLAGSYKQVLDALLVNLEGLSEGELARVLHDTAVDFYSLSTSK